MAESEKYITGRPVKSIGNGLSFFGSLGFFAWVIAGSLISRVFISGDLFVQSIIFLFGMVWAIFGPFSLSFFLVEIGGRALHAGKYRLAYKIASAGVAVDKAVLPLVNAVGLFDTPLAVLNLLNLANAQIVLCEFDKATANLELALDKSQAVLGWENQLTQTVTGLLAGSYLYLCRFTEAESYLNKAITYKENQAKDIDLEAEFERMSLLTSVSLDKFTKALLMEKLQKPEKAEKYFREAIVTIIDNTEYDTDMLANHLNRLGAYLTTYDRIEEAEPLILRSYEIYKKLFAETHPLMSSAYEVLGYLRFKQERYDEAEDWLDKAIVVRRRADLERHPDHASSLRILGEIKLAQGDIEAAEKYFEEAIQIYEETVSNDYPDLLDVFKPYQKLLEKKDCEKEASEIGKRIDEIQNQL